MSITRVELAQSPEPEASQTELEIGHAGFWGKQGWCSGDSTRLPPMIPRTRRHMWVEFVVGSRPCPERFFSGYSVFILYSKSTCYKKAFTFLRNYYQRISHLPEATVWQCLHQQIRLPSKPTSFAQQASFRWSQWNPSTWQSTFEYRLWMEHCIWKEIDWYSYNIG